MKDIDSQELQVGDRVAYQSGGRYPDIRVVTVKGFTPKMVKTTCGTVSANKLTKLFRQDENDGKKV